MPQKGGPKTSMASEERPDYEKLGADPTVPTKYQHSEIGFCVLPPLPSPSFLIPLWQNAWVHFRFLVPPNPSSGPGPAPILFLLLHIAFLVTNFNQGGTPSAAPYSPHAVLSPVTDLCREDRHPGRVRWRG